MRRWLAGHGDFSAGGSESGAGRRVKSILVALPWFLGGPGAIWAVVRLGGWDQWYPATQLIAFTPYVAALSLLPLAILVVMRHWPAAVVAGLTSVALAACVIPRAVPDGDALAGASGPQLRVLTANVLAGRASAAELVGLVREHRVDVLALQEVTPGFATDLDRAGVAEVLPFRVAYPDHSVVGSAIFARHALRDDGVRVNPLEFGQAKAELVEFGLLIESVHPVAPALRSRMPGWRQSFANQPVATVDGPLRVLAGDFNATLDHSVMRSLLSSGYRDAADVAGKGLTGTWGPYDGDRIPPVTLDRVLADRRIGVVDVHIFHLTGSDHRPVLAILRLP